MFQTSRDGSNKSLGMLRNAQKHQFGTFHGLTGLLSTSDSIEMGRMKGSARVGWQGPPLCETHDSKILIHELKKHFRLFWNLPRMVHQSAALSMKLFLWTC